MDNSIFEDFLKEFDELKGVEILSTIRKNKNFELGIVIGRFLHSLFPNNLCILEEYSICAYHTAQYELSFALQQKMLRFRTLDEKGSTNIIQNSLFCVDMIKDKFIYYPDRRIKKIMTNNKLKNKKYKLITFTITTCKRLELFKQTMNSFINCCQDHHMIDEWICVDDNSTDDDRKEMMRLYPFFKFIFKKEEEKGHANSMNLLLDNISTPYIFHMEDDWKFFVKDNYMSKCLEVLGTGKVQQCLINKNYSEVASLIKGGFFNITDSGLRYYLHEYYDNQYSYQKFYERHGVNTQNCAYWAHYSLRPSMIKTMVFKKLGYYNPSASHFEMDYAYRYIDSGFKSGFLEGIYCLHIGRLTSERFDLDKENAYTLNNEIQFGNKKLNYDCIVINLDRRLDRLKKFKEDNSHIAPYFKKFSAIDGTKLKSSIQLQRIFQNNNYRMKTGIVGCALSHLSIWCDYVNNSEEIRPKVIVEDDIVMVKDFTEKVDKILDLLIDTDWDIIMLGHHERDFAKAQYSPSNTFRIEKWSTTLSIRRSLGGTGGYIISKKGANRMLNFINKYGMLNAIDTMIQRAADSLGIYYVIPHLFTTGCCVYDLSIDSDIQHSDDSDNNRLYKWSVKDIIEEFRENNIPVKLKSDEEYNISINMSDNITLYTKLEYKDKIYLDRLKVDNVFNLTKALSFIDT